MTSTNNNSIKTIKDLGNATMLLLSYFYSLILILIGDELTALHASWMIVTNESNSRTHSNFSILNLIKEIQKINISSIDKNEFNRFEILLSLQPIPLLLLLLQLVLLLIILLTLLCLDKWNLVG